MSMMCRKCHSKMNRPSRRKKSQKKKSLLPQYQRFKPLSHPPPHISYSPTVSYKEPEVESDSLLNTHLSWKPDYMAPVCLSAPVYHIHMSSS